VHVYNNSKNEKIGPPMPSSVPSLGIDYYFEEYISEGDGEI
jgi:hypothetical protein